MNKCHLMSKGESFPQVNGYAVVMSMNNYDVS